MLEQNEGKKNLWNWSPSNDQQDSNRKRNLDRKLSPGITCFPLSAPAGSWTMVNCVKNGPRYSYFKVNYVSWIVNLSLFSTAKIMTSKMLEKSESFNLFVIFFFVFKFWNEKYWWWWFQSIFCRILIYNVSVKLNQIIPTTNFYLVTVYSDWWPFIIYLYYSWLSSNFQLPYFRK